jgi:DoxX-like family
MNPRLRRIAIDGLRWTVGLVVLFESCRLAFWPSEIHAFSKSGLPGWIRPGLAGSEIVAAVLFLVPLTSVAGSYLLLLVFLLAALVHVLHGQYDVGVLAVYSMAVLVSLAHRQDARGEVAHDRP